MYLFYHRAIMYYAVLYCTVLCTSHAITGLGTVPMQNVGFAIQELKRCVQELHMAGVQIGSHICGKSLDDADYEPFWEVGN